MAANRSGSAVGSDQASSLQLPALRNSFLELFGRKLSRRAFADQVAELVSQAIPVRAVAVLGYERRRDRLGVFADRDLTPQARNALGGKNERAWEIPLRGLHNRRISVIEAAHQNPFVPKGIIDLSPSSLAIACLPIYHDFKPVAVVLLFAAKSQAFPDADLQILSQALRVAARGLREGYGVALHEVSTAREEEIAESAISELIEEASESVRAAHAPRERTEQPEPAAQAPRVAEAERAQLLEARQVTDTLLARVQRLEQDLARAHAELERSAETARELTAARHSLVRERDRLKDELAEFEHRRDGESADLRAQNTALEDRLLALESERLRYQRAADLARNTAQQSVANLEAEREALRERLRNAESTATEAQTVLATQRADRDHLAAQIEAFSRQLQAQDENLKAIQARHAQELAVVTTDLAGWKDRAAALQEQVAERAEQHRQLDREFRTATADRGATTQQLAAARDEIERLTALHEEVAGSATQAEAARAAAAAEGVALREMLDEERANHLRQQEELRAEITEVRADANRLSLSLGTMRTELGRRDRLVAERDEQLSTLLREQDAGRREKQEWERSTASLREEIAALNAQLQQSRIEHQRGTEEHVALQHQLEQILSTRGNTEQALAADLQEARERLGRVEAERDSAQKSMAEAQGALEHAEAARAETVQHLDAETAELRTQNEALGAERATLRRRLEQAERGIAESAERGQSEARRAATLAERCTGLEKSLAEGETRRTELTADLAQARSELEALRQQSADRGVLARKTTDLSNKVVGLEQLLESARAEVESIRAEHSRGAQQSAALSQELQALRHHEQRATAANREIESLREQLARLADERQRLHEDHAARLAAAETQRLAHATTLAEVQEALERTRDERDRATAERDQRTTATATDLAAANEATAAALQENRDIGQRMAEKQRRIDELTEALHQRDASVDSAQAERRRLEENLRGAEETAAELRHECDGLHYQIQVAIDEVEAERRHHAEALADLEHSYQARIESEQRAAQEREERARQSSQLAMDEKRVARYETPLIIERSAPLGTVITTSSPTVTPDSSAPAELAALHPAGEIVVLDEGSLGDDARAALEATGLEARVAPPSNATVDKLARRKIGAVLVNVVGGTSSWQLIKTLRERVGTRNVPLLVYLMTPDTPTGFSFGRTDFLLWPADPGRLLERLRLLRPTLRRLLVATHDIDTMGKIREPLTRAGVSTSIVLDGRQARDLASSIHPEAAILHLSPECTDIARTVATFRSSDAAREMPLLIVLDKASSGREEAFLTSLNRELLRSGTFEFGDIPAELARLLA